jgi:hypothetical protein
VEQKCSVRETTIVFARNKILDYMVQNHITLKAKKNIARKKIRPGSFSQFLLCFLNISLSRQSTPKVGKALPRRKKWRMMAEVDDLLSGAHAPYIENSKRNVISKFQKNKK